MAPQRRSQRQRRPAAAAEPGTACRGESADCQPLVDQEAAAVPPSKRRRHDNSSAGCTADPYVAPLSDFEAQRAARIAANQARLAALQLPQMAADLAATTAVVRKKVAATQRGITNKRNRGQQLPSRQSARTRGEAPDPSTAGGIDFEARDGRVVLAAFVPERYAASTARPGEPAAVIRPPPEPFAFASSNGGESTDGAFLQQLQEAARVRVGAACECPSRATKAMGADAIMQLQLQAVDVAKLTTQGVSCMAFHPTSSKPLIAAADKSGKVGLWDVDHQAADSDDDGFDGVLMFEPHRDYISSLKWLGPSGAALMTGSYDGVVRRLDVESGVWHLVPGVPGDPEENNWSAGDVTPDGAVIYLATSSGQLNIVDTRCCQAVNSGVLISTRKVNTLHLHGDCTNLLSSASDGTVAVWDARQLAGSNNGSRAKLCKPVTSAQHPKSSQSALWEPNGGRRALSISFDDTLKIWQFNSATLTPQVNIRHNNNTGRWIMPFRPAWAPAGDAVCVGDMKRGVAVFNDKGAAVRILSAEALTAIPSRVVMHPCGLLAAATSSGRVHVFR